MRADAPLDASGLAAWLTIQLNRVGEQLTHHVRTWEQRRSLPQRKRSALLGFLLALLLAGLSVWLTLAVCKSPSVPIMMP